MKKHIVLSEYWIGDTVYHKVSGKCGLVVGVQFRTKAQIAIYSVSFGHTGEDETMCDDTELSAEKVFVEAEATTDED